ncbi:hypothetical protein DQ238_18330 [Geodermatophilus sp. TF02-6]|uniref:enolase C-terminal domain-like protein n=1 Tax=Geodermatophilus sp. TF02-6 TaxID=2250575 RepID=UPI000DEA6C4F|nr:enolase C-terminal domain-like protein [Geodermatophilus sp. TF02-6]RBY76112.1 hypothetical protein DQ238_18330 [Geodermatophilus sp. TF02-6]
MVVGSEGIPRGLPSGSRSQQVGLEGEQSQRGDAGREQHRRRDRADQPHQSRRCSRLGGPAGAGVFRRRTRPGRAAGEYGYDLAHFRRMCATSAVDRLQIYVTRGGGILEWQRAATVAAARA